jgi:hypothetical protein
MERSRSRPYLPTNHAVCVPSGSGVMRMQSRGRDRSRDGEFSERSPLWGRRLKNGLPSRTLLTNTSGGAIGRGFDRKAVLIWWFYGNGCGERIFHRRVRLFFRLVNVNNGQACNFAQYLGFVAVFTQENGLLFYEPDPRRAGVLLAEEGKAKPEMQLQGRSFSLQLYCQRQHEWVPCDAGSTRATSWLVGSCGRYVQGKEAAPVAAWATSVQST